MGSNSGTLQFNDVGVVAPGNHTVTICYTNGDATRDALLSVNGGQGIPVSFPSTGSFQTVGSKQITITLNTGCNTLKFYNPIVGSWAPDFDRIQFNCPTCAVPTPTPTPTPTLARRASVGDFNGDQHPDFVLRNASTLQTAIWYLNNNVYIGGALGPTHQSWVGPGERGRFDRDVAIQITHLFNSDTTIKQPFGTCQDQRASKRLRADACPWLGIGGRQATSTAMAIRTTCCSM